MKTCQKTFETRRLLLRPINESDLKTLYHWRNDSDFLENCSNRREKVTFNEFQKELKRDFEYDRHVQMMVVLKRTGESIGTIYSYGFKIADGYAFVTTFITKEYQQNGYGAEAFAAFVLYLFSNYPLFKLYLEVYEYNRSSLDAINGARFKQEGEFLGHRLFKGKRYNTIRFAVYQNDIARFQNLLVAMNIEKKGGE